MLCFEKGDCNNFRTDEASLGNVEPFMVSFVLKRQCFASSVTTIGADVYKLVPSTVYLLWFWKRHRIQRSDI